MCPAKKIKLCVQLKHIMVTGWSETNDHNHSCGLPLPQMHFCSFHWNKSPWSFTAAYTGGLQESQTLPAIPGAVQVPRTNKRDYLSCAQRPRARLQQNRTELPGERVSSPADPGLSLILFSISCAGLGALLNVNSHQDTRPAQHRATSSFFLSVAKASKGGT